MSAEFWWTVAVTAVMLAFNIGVFYQMVNNMKKVLEEKPSNIDVTKMIEKKLISHCPNTSRILELENHKAEMLEYREKIADELKSETKETHSSLQEIKFNLKSLCKKQNVDYIETNGHK